MSSRTQLWLPTTFWNLWTVPRSAQSPTSTSLIVNLESLEQSLISQAEEISIPPPIQYPWMQQITGTLQTSNAPVRLYKIAVSSMIFIPFLKKSSSSPPWLHSPRADYYKSSPTVKYFPSPLSITTLALLFNGLTSSRVHFSNSSNIKCEIALSFFGLFKVIVCI